MSGSQKALKVVSVLLIIYAVVMTAFGIFLVAGGSFLAGETIDVNGTAEAANVMAAALGGGTIVGEHEVMFAGEDEIITLSHSARSKRVFAAGALKAASFMKGKPAGRYDMKNVIDGMKK